MIFKISYLWNKDSTFGIWYAAYQGDAYQIQHVELKRNLYTIYAKSYYMHYTLASSLFFNFLRHEWSHFQCCSLIALEQRARSILHLHLKWFNSLFVTVVVQRLTHFTEFLYEIREYFIGRRFILSRNPTNLKIVQAAAL